MSGNALLRLAGKVVRHPGRAVLRGVLRMRVALANRATERDRLFALLAARGAVDPQALVGEYRHSAFARRYRERLAELGGHGGPLRMGTTGGESCETLYVVVRALRPRRVVETGVLYGASSAHVLAALEANGEGELHSIDLGVSPGEPPNDFLVPAELKPRWHLIIGDTRQELPPLLARLGSIDMFHHDSLHTYDHMLWEYAAALRGLRPGGVLSSDDVRIAHSLRGMFSENAFPAFCRREGLQPQLMGNYGLALRPS